MDLKDLERETLDGLSKHAKAMYVEDNGIFKFDPSLVPDIASFDDTLEKLRGIEKNSIKDKKEASKTIADLNAMIADNKSKYGEIDVDKYTEMSDAIKKAEEDALIADGKKDELYASRLESNNSDWQKKLDAQKVLIDEASETFNTANSRIESLQKRALDASILNGINGVFHPEANEDAVMLASTLFKLNDKDVAVMTDETGKEISPKDWATSADLKARKPHWYAASGNGTNAQQQQRNNEQNAEAYKGSNQADSLEWAREQQRKQT